MKEHRMIVLLVILSLCALWFTGSAIWKSVHYIRLNSNTMPQSITWTVEEKTDERYLLHGNYTFNLRGREYKGEDTLQSPYFLNAWATEQAIKNKSFDLPSVWYSSIQPQYSALQKKNFHLKNVYRH